MATTTSATSDHRDLDATVDSTELRYVPLSRIVVPDGFNPRGAVDADPELEQMAESIRRDGCLQPIRVRATEHGNYLLISGERRYRAAVKASVMELPAIIRPAGPGDEDEQADLLVEALLENDLRRDLDPVARARGYQRLIDAGRTVKGVAERLQTTQARVREHLRILKLPDTLRQHVASGEIPLCAVKPLAKLESIHAGLALAAAREVLDSRNDPHGYEPYSWADVERAPLAVALAANDLPDGVYRTHTPYPLDRFTLSETAKKDLDALERMLGRPVSEIRFDHTDLEQAKALGAAHGDDDWQAIIIGTDVAAQLASDQLARAVKEMRRRERARRDAESQGPAAPDPNAYHAPDDRAPERAAQEAEEARRAQRDAERQDRERATRFNLELGRSAYTTLSRVRVDESTLKILASVEMVGGLGDVAMRGARYGLPGWVTETTQKNGNTKYAYLERAEADQRATDYLQGAVKAGEIAGRQLVLVVMATYADQHAVATSNRSWHEVKASGPWAGEVDELLDKLVRDNLPDSALQLLAPVIDERQQRQRERADARKARQEAAERLDGIEQRIDELTLEQVDQAEHDLDAACTGWTPTYSSLRQQLATRRQQLADASSATE